MTHEQLVMFCSPTLAGLKTGSLFNCTYKLQDDGAPLAREAVISEFRELNQDLNPKGLRVIPLLLRQKSVLTYMYRPTELEKDFRDPAVRALLDELGYEGLGTEQCITRLQERLNDREKEFPHEIGLFLGYPVEDVRGFIEQGSDRFKCNGCWKVYGDERAAKELFCKYDRCTACYLNQLAAGTDLCKLAVAV